MKSLFGLCYLLPSIARCEFGAYVLILIFDEWNLWGRFGDFNYPIEHSILVFVSKCVCVFEFICMFLKASQFTFRSTIEKHFYFGIGMFSNQMCMVRAVQHMRG